MYVVEEQCLSWSIIEGYHKGAPTEKRYPICNNMRTGCEGGALSCEWSMVVGLPQEGRKMKLLLWLDPDRVRMAD